VVNCLHLKEIKELRDVQKKAIEAGVIDGSCVYVASPSTSGKTLVGEIAITHALINDVFAKAVYLVPNKAAVEEKASMFRKTCELLHLNMFSFYEESQLYSEKLSESRLLLVTYERFALLIQRNPGWLKELRCLVVDDAHLIGSDFYGVILEGVLTRLKTKKPSLQIVGLSTITKNASALASWLGCTLVESRVRSVPVKFSVRITQNKLKDIAELTNHIIKRGGQVLVYVTSRKNAEEYANNLLQTVTPLLPEEVKEDLSAEMQELEELPGWRHEKRIIGNLIAKGVSFFHSGLAFRFRQIVERLFEKNLLKLVVCTTSFGAGLTIPARLVILSETENILDFRQEKKKSKELDANTVHRILDKAGRQGFDSQGFAIILAETATEEKSITNRFFNFDQNGELTPKYSSLQSQLDTLEELKSQILIESSQEVGVTREGLEDFLNKTFYAYQHQKTPSALSSLLNMQTLTARETLKTFSSEKIFTKAENTPDKDIHITEVEKTHLEGKVRSTSKTKVWHQCAFDQKKGIRCDCEFQRYKTKKDDPTLCRHLTALGLQALDSPPYSETSEQIITLSLGEHSIIHDLVQQDLLYLEGNRLISSPMGLIVSELFLDPCIITRMKVALLKSDNFTVDEMLNIAITSAKCSMYPIFSILSNPDTKSILTDWIEEALISDISWSRNVYAGDIRSMIDQTMVLTQAITAITQEFGKKHLTELSKTLHTRLKWGIKKDAVLLLTQLGARLDRRTVRILMNSGIRSTEDLVKMKLSPLAKSTGISQVNLKSLQTLAKELQKDQ
jgi:replicative superfamily II helicase